MKVIATTLAEPEGLRGAVAYAQAAGVLVTSFNAGVESAAELGSLMHLEINNRETGVQLGQTFAELGLDGAVLCVLHEAENVSLVERCEGIQEGYGGAVEQLDVSAEREAEGGGEIVTATYAAIAARQGPDASDGDLHGSIPRGLIDYFVFDHGLVQGYMAVVNAYFTQWFSTFVDIRGQPSILFELSSLIYDEDALLELAYGASAGN